MNLAAQFTAEDYDRAAIDAEKHVTRWKWETTLLSIIAAKPKYRFPMARTLGVVERDFTGDDTQIIYRALAVGHEHGRTICAKLIRNLLIEENLWDENDLRPFCASCAWGPAPLASFATRAMFIESPAVEIVDAMRQVRSLPTIPPMRYRRAG